MKVQLLHEVAPVVVSGFGADIEALRDFAGRVALCNELEDLPFSCGECIEPISV